MAAQFKSRLASERFPSTAPPCRRSDDNDEGASTPGAEALGRSGAGAIKVCCSYRKRKRGRALKIASQYLQGE